LLRELQLVLFVSNSSVVAMLDAAAPGATLFPAAFGATAARELVIVLQSIAGACGG
jgi:hypothetical protein